MISVYLCEDDIHQLNHLEKIIENIIKMYELDMQIAAACITPKELLTAIASKPPHMAAYFLDIDLKSEIDGIELGVEIRKLDPRAFMIFITTHDEMMANTFHYKVETLDYIIKNEPGYLGRIQDVLFNISEKYRSPAEEARDLLQIAVGKKICKIRLQDICFIESIINSHKIAIHLDDETIECFSTLKAIQRQLNDDFMQCHKAYIVNCRQVKVIDGSQYRITFYNDQSCDCSTRLFKKLYEKIADSKI